MLEGEKRRRFTPGRLLDIAAVAVLAFVLWKIFLAPRTFSAPGTAPAPHVVYERLDGGTFRMTGERGHVVFLDFFASWCEPCRVETPIVEKWAREHPNVTVVPVDVGEPRIVAQRYAQQMHLMHVAIDPSGSSQGYFNVQGFPTVVVVDGHGDIRAAWAGLNPAIALAMTNAEKTLR
jgi:thiol-disulfide isomerase/thioredoxin